MRLPNCTPAGQNGLDCDLDEFVSLLNEHAQPDMLDLLCGSPSADGPTVASGGRAAAGAGIYDSTQLQ